MAELTTFQTAQTRSVEYLTEILRLMPPGTYLSTRYPGAPTDSGFVATTLTCDDNASDSSGPKNLGTTYWVVGVERAEANRVVNAVGDSWEKGGLRRVDRRPEGAFLDIYATTPDDYRLVVGHNAQNEVSVSVSSPCFPRPSADEKPHLPDRIDHP
ncbi:hypothetical protein [Nocardia camponoti]|uniref:Uncharacterized protein n=1 Tax=Nocardia camponoti TaxID=1616106 RepID=A0A917V591_9NOCA|nr:hypothetical protein [Nocardia camponoti]GGK38592.1 hypothetical protein GCM10011591_07930 [Nocardia camponoti]